VVNVTNADRICAVAAAAAHDLNDELTVILSSVAAMRRELEAGDPGREQLVELQAAAQRCAWIASGLLNFSARKGARPSAATFERMAEEDGLR
jgi:hypothetical protein